MVTNKEREEQKKMKKYLGKEKGITLIALVITILVMLILAGVTINLTLGENGIFTTAQQAARNYTEAQEKELAYLEGFTNQVNNIVNPAPLGTIIKTEDGVNYTADGVGNTIPVPVGFSPITTEDQGTKDTGFVIKNDADGNEFVWVPVDSVENYKRIAWQRDGWSNTQGTNGIDTTTQSIKITRLGRDEDTYYWIEEMPGSERSSVNAYGGFYIGRYEAGVTEYSNSSKTTDGSTTWTGYTGENTTLVVQDDQEVWNYITRDKAKEVAEGLYKKDTNNVESRLCSSYAWDSALRFIEKRNSAYPTNSVSTGQLQKTGYYAVNNIYDMDGNTTEWTTESYSTLGSPCVARGGSINSISADYPAAFRSASNTTAAYEYVSFRVTLFM